MFSAIARRYDLLNTVLSLGLHHWWKRRAAAAANGGRALDIASGTGDIARRLAASGARVVALDISLEMLRIAQAKLHEAALYVQGDAEQLPFPDGAFEAVTIGFGLRNVPDRERALREMRRVLAPGGRLVVLEFATPRSRAVRWLYDRYSFAVIPRVAGWLARNPDAYRYLVASIREFPDRETLAAMLRAAGFDRVRCTDLTLGIVAIHVAARP